MAPARPDGPGGLPRDGLVLLALVTLAWGLAWPAMKIVLNEMSPWTFREVTLPAGGLILMAFARMVGQPLAVPRRKWTALIVVSLINVGGWHLFSALGLSQMSSGRAVLVAYTMPLWASLAGAVLLGEAVTRRLGIALVLGMAGVAVLLSGDLAALRGAPWGIVYMLVAAMFWGVGIVLLKRVVWEMPPLALAAWQLIVSSIPIALLAGMVEGWTLPALSPLALATLVFVIVVPIGFCSWAFLKVITLFPANVSAIGTLMIPVVGVLSGSLILGEPIGWREMASLALIGSSLVLTLFYRR
ncbi:DMT family transporter [Shumkonia mesophila]|uniref:DMT family transporter n=1 Tax=Shumkonia mesophila TaxID=2838854 RepID=UPI0029341A22|nr:DMT family transporter [Shumkonia mesophila]